MSSRVIWLPFWRRSYDFELADILETIPYEILTSVAHRVPRIYKSNQAIILQIISVSNPPSVALPLSEDLYKLS